MAKPPTIHCESDAEYEARLHREGWYERLAESRRKHEGESTSGTSGIRYLGDVQRLSLGPGDIVVLKTAVVVTGEQAAALRAALQAVLGTDRKVVVLPAGLEIGVLSPELA